MATAYHRIATALQRCGLDLCADRCLIRSADDLAARIDVAARNYAAGKKKAARERFDDDDGGLDGLPEGTIPEGRWD